MSFLLSVLSGLKIFPSSSVTDDFTDRLHYQLSTGLLVAFAILVSFKQFGGKPMECMVPETFSGPWEEYAEQYCFAMNTYFLPIKNQWVPFVLIIEAACFQLPFMAWKVLGHHSGIRLHDLVDDAADKKNLDQNTRTQTIHMLKTHLENALKFHRRLFRRKVQPHGIMRCLNLPYTSCYVSLMFLFCKGLYLTNAAGQFFLMNWFLETSEDDYYGWQTIAVRVVGNVQRYTMQCVLVINMLNEKIFLFLWFWYNILMAMTVLSMIYWGIILFIPFFNRSFVSRHMELCDMPFDSKDSEKDVERFVTSYLHTDGIFAVRMIEMQSNVIFGTDLVMALWKSFYHIEEVVSNWSHGGTMSAPVGETLPPITQKGMKGMPGGNNAQLRWRSAAKKARNQGPDSETEDERDKDRRGKSEVTRPAHTAIDWPDSGGHRGNESAPILGHSGAPEEAEGPRSAEDRRPGTGDRAGFLRGLACQRGQILTPEHLSGPGARPRLTVIDDARPPAPSAPSSTASSPFGRPIPPPADATPASLAWLEQTSPPFPPPNAFSYSTASTHQLPSYGETGSYDERPISSPGYDPGQYSRNPAPPTQRFYHA